MPDIGQKNYRKRLNKYLPDEGLLVRKLRSDSEIINVYSWKNNPIELWVWNVGPRGPTRIELHKLEKYPTHENIVQPLAMYQNMREVHRRKEGTLAGPGLGKDRVLRECYEVWKESGYDPQELKTLEQRYLDSRPDPHNTSASRSYFRQMRRIKAKDIKKKSI